MFQSTRPQGARLAWVHLHRLYRRVSIHAPTRGATMVSLYDMVLLQSFNPRAHKGRDMNAIVNRAGRGWFQSTRPQGARLKPVYMHPKTCFVSIHAPTRGATGHTGYLPRSSPVSIHAPTRGATEGICAGNYKCHVSIHAPTRGATKNRGEVFRRIYVSIHAPTRGAT